MICSAFGYTAYRYMPPQLLAYLTWLTCLSCQSTLQWTLPGVSHYWEISNIPKVYHNSISNAIVYLIFFTILCNSGAKIILIFLLNVRVLWNIIRNSSHGQNHSELSIPTGICTGDHRENSSVLKIFEKLINFAVEFSMLFFPASLPRKESEDTEWYEKNYPDYYYKRKIICVSK